MRVAELFQVNAVLAQKLFNFLGSESSKDGLLLLFVEEVCIALPKICDRLKVVGKVTLNEIVILDWSCINFELNEAGVISHIFWDFKQLNRVNYDGHI